jgi:hypothetical protein
MFFFRVNNLNIVRKGYLLVIFVPSILNNLIIHMCNKEISKTSYFKKKYNDTLNYFTETRLNKFVVGWAGHEKNASGNLILLGCWRLSD